MRTPGFSHREALRKPGARCVNCHAAAASSTLSKVPNLRFNHKLHLALGNVAPAIAAAIDAGKYLGDAGATRARLNTQNACGACHRGLEQATHASKADMPRMADCLVCHNEIEPPFSCEKCHADTAALRPASHTPDWLERHSRRNAQFDRASCRICHGVRFRCMGCH